jgi:hypothetical protein
MEGQFREDVLSGEASGQHRGKKDLSGAGGPAEKVLCTELGSKDPSTSEAPV